METLTLIKNFQISLKRFKESMTPGSARMDSNGARKDNFNLNFFFFIIIILHYLQSLH